MGFIILAALIGVPLVEIAVFIKVGGLIGLWPTIAIVVATAMAGAAMLRHQGLTVLARAQDAMARHELPVAAIIDGVCLLVAGALLLTPGFVTDTLGFVLMIPGLRMAIAAPILRRLAERGGFRARHGDSVVIDAEFEEVRPDRPKRGADGDRRLPPHNGSDGR